MRICSSIFIIPFLFIFIFRLLRMSSDLNIIKKKIASHDAILKQYNERNKRNKAKKRRYFRPYFVHRNMRREIPTTSKKTTATKNIFPVAFGSWQTKNYQNQPSVVFSLTFFIFLLSRFLKVIVDRNPSRLGWAAF